MTSPEAPVAAKPPRIRSVDWHRGLVVLVMIECHALVFLASVHDQEPARAFLNNINGLVAPSFLFLAGFAFAYVSSNVAGDPVARRRRAIASLKRIGQVLIGATLMRCVSSPAITNPALRYWLQVDILSCIAYSLLLIWALFRLIGQRPNLCGWICLVLGLGILGCAPLTEGVRDAGAITYFLNGSTGSMFPVAPWASLVFLGGAAGVAARHGVRWHRLAFAGFVALFGTIAFFGTDVMSLYSSPHSWLVANASERIWKLAAIGLVLSFVEGATHATPRFADSIVVRFVTFFGTHSLSAYCAHLLMIYGAWGFHPLNRFHGRLEWASYAGTAAAIIAATYVVCRLLDRAPTGK